MKKNLKGFTLVEVLIVIIIVGILIAALLPRLVGSQARARDTARAAHLNQIAQGAALYAADNNTQWTGCINSASYTSTFSGVLASVPSDPLGASAAQVGTCVAGEYAIYRTVDGNMVAVGDVEVDANGNCDKPTSSATTGATITAPTITDEGDGICVVVR